MKMKAIIRLNAPGTAERNRKSLTGTLVGVGALRLGLGVGPVGLVVLGQAAQRGAQRLVGARAVAPHIQRNLQSL